ncbi:Acyl carrier protein 2, chloroplastic, partial [Cucurbita argyrosperma subsp. sororia]
MSSLASSPLLTTLASTTSTSSCTAWRSRNSLFARVEIMMALEEKFGVSIGEGGAEGISTVQDAADLIEKVKTSSAS